MKRAICMMLAGVLGLLIFCACSSGDTPTSRPKPSVNPTTTVLPEIGAQLYTVISGKNPVVRKCEPYDPAVDEFSVSPIDIDATRPSSRGFDTTTIKIDSDPSGNGTLKSLKGQKNVTLSLLGPDIAPMAMIVHGRSIGSNKRLDDTVTVFGNQPIKRVKDREVFVINTGDFMPNGVITGLTLCVAGGM